MSRHLRPLLLLACLIALPALAAQSVADGGACPGPASETAAATDAADASATASTGSTAKTQAGGSARPSDSAPRNRPRWQSFLPGMVR